MSVQTQIDRIAGKVSEQSSLIQQIKTALEGKTAGPGTGTPETWTFTMEDDSTVEKVVYVDA